jgi:hypothetical protein
VTATIIPKKALRPAATHDESGATTHSWDLYLDGELVASGYVSEVAARMELDLAAWYALFGEARLLPDTPITDEALDLALAVFNRLFTTEKVQHKGRLTLEKIIRTEIYTIAIDGSLRVLASSGRGKQSSYTVTAHTSLPDDAADNMMGSYHVTMACAYKDFYARAHEHGGVCKHVADRLLNACLFWRWDCLRPSSMPSRWRWDGDKEQGVWEAQIRPRVEEAWQARTAVRVAEIALEILAIIGLPQHASTHGHVLMPSDLAIVVGGGKMADRALGREQDDQPLQSDGPQ